MTILYVGDIHGVVDDVAKIDRLAVDMGVDTVVQVGDFGIWWPKTNNPLVKYFKKRARQNRPGPVWYTCGGNHENYDKWLELRDEQGDPATLVDLAPGVHWVVRGRMITLEGQSHLFLGGAESIDKHHRAEGTTWWAYESPTYEEFSTFFNALEDQKPEVVVTHDAPTFIDCYGDGHANMNIDRGSQPTPRNFQNIWKISTHRPAQWYFGHHHVLGEWESEGTTFRCCGLGGQYWAGA